MAVELLLKEYNANPNVVDNKNHTTVMCWTLTKDKKLSILRILAKYGFDFAKLINQPENEYGVTVLHFLCMYGNSGHNIACIKDLFSICKKIPECSINILAQNHQGLCALHHAIYNKDIDMIKYLLENVYFPNNDKLNKDGIAFINMKILGIKPLGPYVMEILATEKDRNVKRDLELFKLLVSYGVKFNAKDQVYFQVPIIQHYTKLVAFMLDENLCPLDTFDTIIGLMYKVNAKRSGIVNTDIVKSLYNYGLKHGLISNKIHHAQIFAEAAKYDLATCRSTMLMILEKHGINDLKQYSKCDIFNERTLQSISQLPNTKPNVKSFIEALISHDETKLLKLDEAVATSNKVVLTCINNHKINNNNDNKLFDYKQKCSICGDSGDGSQLLSGFQCDECKSFICDDCIIVQKISKKINDNCNNETALIAVADQILEYKNNKKLLNKVEWIKFDLSHAWSRLFIVCFLFCCSCRGLIDC